MTNGTKLMEVLTQDGMTISGADLFTKPLEEMTTDEAHFAWSVIDVLEKGSKERKDEIRDRLLDDAKERGEKTDKGHFVLVLENGRATAQRKLSKAKVDQKVVRDLLMKKGIPVAQVLVKKTVQDFDQKAFDALVKDGQISEEEAAVVMGTAKESFSLIVEKPGFLQKALKSGRKDPEPEIEEEALA